MSRNLGLGSGARVRQWALRAAGVVALAALVAVGVVVWQRASTPAPIQYRQAAVSVGDIHAVIDATGTVEPVRTVQVGPDVSGRIVAVHADYNDAVTAGQLLVEIDPLPFRARRAEARARLTAARAGARQAEATLADARRTGARYEALAGTGAIADRELDSARTAVEQAEAAVQNARAQIAIAQAALESAETDLERTSVRSPVDGVVLQRQAEPGQAVAATFQPPILFVIADDLGRMELRLAVDEADIGRVAEGQTARFTVDAYPTRTFEAAVRSVRNAPSTVQGVVTYEVVLDVDNPDRVLRPGMTASARVEVAQATGVTRVPNAALRFAPPGHTAEGTQVWVQRDGGPVAIPVERGLDDGTQTEVRGELSTSDQVLVDVVRPEE